MFIYWLRCITCNIWIPKRPSTSVPLARAFGSALGYAMFFGYAMSFGYVFGWLISSKKKCIINMVKRISSLISSHRMNKMKKK